ncbi:MAG: carboxylesterase family protein [Deltaproteobacteria bacterium]|nr:carboxylesterase family protein [Deltaproteobacteria bacterium]
MTIRKLSAVIFIVFLFAGIFLSGCTRQEEKVEKAVEPELLIDPIKTDSGYISGTLIGDIDNPVRAYRGIPYAAPPVGDLRWKPTQPVTSWDEILQCTEFSRACPQLSMSGFPPPPMSEDCLYLNVMTPAKNKGESLPVMVWMHGGGYSSGSGNDAMTNLHRLPQHGVVLVNVTMRINTFGLLAHPLLTAESPDNSSGNYMFLDMIASLRWVQRNISAFGGNPDNVTIFGESGGGAKVSTLMASPLAKGLFHKAICESGTAIGGFSMGQPLAEIEEQGVKFFKALGVDKADDPLKAARGLPFEKILEARKTIMKASGDGMRMNMDNSAVDGWLLPKTPTEIFESGEYNTVPLITMATMGEITGPGGLLLPQLIPAYTTMLEYHNKAGAKGYAAIFDHVPAKWRAEGAVAAHSMECLYLFGDYDNRSGIWPIMYSLMTGADTKDTKDPGLTEADKRVSENMMKMWTQFARTGNPNSEGLIEWPAYNNGDDKYMYVADPLEIKTGFSKIKPSSPPQED